MDGSSLYGSAIVSSTECLSPMSDPADHCRYVWEGMAEIRRCVARRGDATDCWTMQFFKCSDRCVEIWLCIFHEFLPLNVKCQVWLSPLCSLIRILSEIELDYYFTYKIVS